MTFNISVILSRTVNSECKQTVFVRGFMSFRVTSGCDIQRSSITQTSLLVPYDPGRLRTLIYAVTVETWRPGQARHTHLEYCTSTFPRNLPGIELGTSRLVAQCHIYRVSQEERAKLREGVPYVKLYRYNPKHLYPKLNGYGDNGQRSLKF